MTTGPKVRCSPTTEELYAFARQRVRECKAAGEPHRVYTLDSWAFRATIRRRKREELLSTCALRATYDRQHDARKRWHYGRDHHVVS